MTSSLKNMLTSVDWSKLMSRNDARNALVGSALGGLLLGGAGLAADRDPEESKYVPVTDALLGAALGGAAAYGIPKGLSLFHDSGSLAPDTDRIDTGYAKPILRGLVGGAAYGGATTIPSILAAKAFLFDNATLNFDKEVAERTGALRDARRELNKARRRGDAKAIADARQRVHDLLIDASAFRDGNGRGSYSRTRERIIARIAAAKANKDAVALVAAKADLKRLKRLRHLADHGYNGFGFVDAINNIHIPPTAKDSTTWYGKAWNKFIPHGGRFAPSPVRAGNSLGAVTNFLKRPAGKMLWRGGKYALVGSGLAALAHALLGPSSRKNFAQ